MNHQSQRGLAAWILHTLLLLWGGGCSNGIEEVAILKAATNAGANDSFASSIGLSADTLVAGAPKEDSNVDGVDGQQGVMDTTNTGAVYVFSKEAQNPFTKSRWTETAFLKASNGEAMDFFGFAVALSGDTLVVGARGENSNAIGVDGDQTDNRAEDSGAVYVFRGAGSNWVQEAYLKASNTDAGDDFGFSVALSGDTLVVGARGENSNATGVDGDQTDNSVENSGAVYVFRKTGATWVQEAYLKASNTGAEDAFGSHVALSGDTLVVSALNEDSNATGVNGDQTNDTAENSGAAYVFRRVGNTWVQEAYLKASNTGASDLFGFDVAISGDTVAVGARDAEGNSDWVNSGAVYVYHRRESTWRQEAYLRPADSSEGFSPDWEYGANFGEGLALSGDNLWVAASGEGDIYLFRRSNSEWTQDFYLKASKGLGSAVGLFENTLAVGGGSGVHIFE